MKSVASNGLKGSNGDSELLDVDEKLTRPTSLSQLLCITLSYYRCCNPTQIIHGCIHIPRLAVTLETSVIIKNSSIFVIHHVLLIIILYTIAISSLQRIVYLALR
jgi:hypothetical protein